MGTTRKATIIIVHISALLVTAVTAYVLARAPILFDAAAMIAKADALILFIGSAVAAVLLLFSLVLTATALRTGGDVRGVPFPASHADHELQPFAQVTNDPAYQAQYDDAAQAASYLANPDLIERRAGVERIALIARPGTVEAVCVAAWFRAYDQELMRRERAPMVASEPHR